MLGRLSGAHVNCICLGAAGWGSAKGISAKSTRCSPACTSSRSLQLLFAGIFIYLSEKGASLHLAAERIITSNTLLCIEAVCDPPSSKNHTEKRLPRNHRVPDQQNHLFLWSTGTPALCHKGREGLWGAMFLLIAAGSLQSAETYKHYFCTVSCGWAQYAATMSKHPKKEAIL